jgi:hypothetical protein
MFVETVNQRSDPIVYVYRDQSLFVESMKQRKMLHGNMLYADYAFLLENDSDRWKVVKDRVGIFNPSSSFSLDVLLAVVEVLYQTQKTT